MCYFTLAMKMTHAIAQLFMMNKKRRVSDTASCIERIHLNNVMMQHFLQ